jgi:hypothetical protein
MTIIEACEPLQRFAARPAKSGVGPLATCATKRSPALYEPSKYSPVCRPAPVDCRRRSESGLAASPSCGGSSERIVRRVRCGDCDGCFAQPLALPPRCGRLEAELSGVAAGLLPHVGSVAVWWRIDTATLGGPGRSRRATLLALTAVVLISW